MFFTAVGIVQDVQRNINGTKLTSVTLRQPYSGQTVENGKWGKKETGFFQYRVFEDNQMAGTNTNFVRFLDTLNPGSIVEVLAEGTMVKKIKDGKTFSNIELTALRFLYVGGKQQEDTPQVKAERAGATEEFTDEAEDSEDDGFVDPLQQW